MHTTCTAALLAAVLSAGFTVPQTVRAVEIEGVSVLISWKDITPGGGTLSSYTYNSATDTYYLATFGNLAGLHSVTRNAPGDPYESGVYIETGTSATPSTLYRFYRATDVPNGNLNVNFSGNPLLSGILLNPNPVTISVPSADAAGVPNGGTTNITYQPGELAFITDGGTHIQEGATLRFNLTKKLYRWDLREVGSPTSQGPDYSTGKSGTAPPNQNPGGLFGAINQADWNDVFTVAMTEEAMRIAYTAKTGLAPSAASTDNYGRQPAWSSNGQFLYTIDSGNPGGGLYKTNAATGATTMLYSENSGTNVIAEPAVVSTSVRDFGAGFGGGDQIMFDGNATNGNAGGMSYVVDTGGSVSGVQSLFTGVQLSAYTGVAAGGVDAIAADVNGNVYFFEGGTSAIHMFDTAGRFRSVLNRAQLFEVNQTNDNRRANGGVLLRFQTRQDGGFTTLTYRGDNDYVGTVQIFDGGDVNRDTVFNQADRNFFVTQINKTFHEGAPNPFDTNNPGLVDSFVDYINADLNGDSVPRSATADGQLPKLNSGGVDYLDLAVLKQFTPLLLGDFDWDGTTLSATDWAIFNTHYNTAPAAFSYLAFSWFDGDVSGAGLDGIPDGLVDEFDFQFLNANSIASASSPEPSTFVLALVSLVGCAVLRRKRGRRVA